MHGHGGIVLESLKMGTLHNNVGASVETGDRYHWYSSTGWIMGTQPGALLGGTTVCTFDGNPGGRIASPDLNTICSSPPTPAPPSAPARPSMPTA